MSPIEKHQDH